MVRQQILFLGSVSYLVLFLFIYIFTVNSLLFFELVTTPSVLIFMVLITLKFYWLLELQPIDQILALYTQVVGFGTPCWRISEIATASESSKD